MILTENRMISNAYNSICESRNTVEYAKSLIEQARSKGIKVIGYSIESDGTIIIRYINRFGRDVRTKIRPENVSKKDWESRHFRRMENGIVRNHIDNSKGFEGSDIPDYLMMESDNGSKPHSKSSNGFVVKCVGGLYLSIEGDMKELSILLTSDKRKATVFESEQVANDYVSSISKMIGMGKASKV